MSGVNEFTIGLDDVSAVPTGFNFVRFYEEKKDVFDGLHADQVKKCYTAVARIATAMKTSNSTSFKLSSKDSVKIVKNPDDTQFSLKRFTACLALRAADIYQHDPSFSVINGLAASAGMKDALPQMLYVAGMEFLFSYYPDLVAALTYFKAVHAAELNLKTRINGVERPMEAAEVFQSLTRQSCGGLTAMEWLKIDKNANKVKSVFALFKDNKIGGRSITMRSQEVYEILHRKLQ